MAFVLKDRVKDTTTTTGTGSVTLSGTAPTGFQNFNAAIGTSNTTYYCIAGQGTSEWEVGLGTLSASTTLARTTVYASSNAGSLVNFSAGTKDVFVTFPASVADQQLKYNLYTANDTWTCPVGVSRIRVVCIAGGGGGGGNNGNPGGAGGKGGLAIGIYTVTPGTGYSVTVGAGGNGATGGSNGGSGNSSSLGSLISATGGAGGISNGGDGADGAGSNGITANASVSTGGVYGSTGVVFAGRTIRPNAVSSTTAQTWSASINYIPGASGNGETASFSDSTGGTSGAVYIEYIG